MLALTRRIRLRTEPLEERQLLDGSGELLPTVALHTNLGAIEMELRADAAPTAVNNFLNYVGDGDYLDSFFHRSVPGFVLQGGGFAHSTGDLCNIPCNGLDPGLFQTVPSDAPIPNEFQLSNVRGTVAMAKLSGNPDSATSEFFFNLNDNAANLDFQNGGFTVFAEVIDMTVVDQIAALSIGNMSSVHGALTDVPFVTNTGENVYQLVRIESVSGSGVVQGKVWQDIDGDGSGESGREGVTVYVDANRDGTYNAGEVSVVTDAAGLYTLRLQPNAYDIRILLPPGAIATSPAPQPSQTITVELGRTTEGPEFNLRPGDVDGDGSLDSSDVTLLASGVGSGTTLAAFDVNLDNQVNAADLTYLVEVVLATQFGDADLDGLVTASDDGAVLLANLGKSGEMGWADGDFSGDSFVTASDDGALLLASLASDVAAGSVQSPTSQPVGENGAAPFAVQGSTWDAVWQGTRSLTSTWSSKAVR